MPVKDGVGITRKLDQNQRIDTVTWRPHKGIRPKDQVRDGQ